MLLIFTIFACRPDWWLHVAGYPGSHVVIRSHDDSLPVKFEETLKDAATLAVINSKCAQSGRVAVSYTRCRNVVKPSGAKDGLVRLTGDVSTIIIDPRLEQKRLLRLEETKIK
jgi:predicted ribosome quality control (RQC) complex YloA/Tae2 family protein